MTKPGNTWPEEWSNMSKASQRKAINLWFEERTNWTLRENEAFTLFQTMILIEKKS